MFVHLGDDVIIRDDEMIAIIDQDLVNSSDVNQSFVDAYKSTDCAVKLGDQPTKSIVVTDKCVYFSPFSTSTLKRRSNVNTLTGI